MQELWRIPMLSLGIEPVQIDPDTATTREGAFAVLANAAQRYLKSFEQQTAADVKTPARAVITRVRGTGPGVSFGSVLAPLLDDAFLKWECPFEGSSNVSGAAIRGADVLDEADRDDGFLVLR